MQDKCGKARNVVLQYLVNAQYIMHMVFQLYYVLRFDSTVDINVPGFFKCFRDPIQVPRIENRVHRIRANYH